MEWDHETCIDLIDEYRNREVLWNPRHCSYYNKRKKDDAWSEISEKIGKDINEVKRKMESLKGSYRREKTRMKQGAGTGKGRNKVYTTKWFGFEHLHFLEEKNEVPNTSSNVQTMYKEEVESGSETQDETFGEENEIKQDQTVEEVLDEQISDKRKWDDEDPLIAKAFGHLEEAAAKQEKDQCSLFGEYIADKLRTFDAPTRATAQHRIGNVLFELEMNAFFQKKCLSTT